MRNFHSHTEFCDARAPMAQLAEAAFNSGFSHWGFSPHSPVCCPSCANMKLSSVHPFLDEVSRLKSLYAGKMELFAGMEIDYISPDFGPHVDFFRNIPLDYRIGSVHFVRTQDGRPVDCDGPSDRFLRFLESDYGGDLRYVAQTYFDMQLEMLSLGGFDIIGHLDKIGDNGSAADSSLEDFPWYADLVRKVIRTAVDRDVVIEINTKKFESAGRFFPSERWWHLLKRFGAKVVVATDAHYPDKVAAGYLEAHRRLSTALSPWQLIDFIPSVR